MSESVKDDLVWREDNAQFYPLGADLGEGYKKCNLHSLLIGRDACGHHHPDFSLGIFMLGPRTLYRDHNHDAPELYLNLSEKSGWRFGTRDWQDYPAGSLIWNAAGDPHATRVYDQPFISVFVWLENEFTLQCNPLRRLGRDRTRSCQTVQLRSPNMISLNTPRVLLY